jgi:hypothetical protein
MTYFSCSTRLLARLEQQSVMLTTLLVIILSMAAGIAVSQARNSWRVQAQAFGGLDRKSLTFLDALARQAARPRATSKSARCGPWRMRDVAQSGTRRGCSQGQRGFGHSGRGMGAIAACTSLMSATRQWPFALGEGEEPGAAPSRGQPGNAS